MRRGRILTAALRSVEPPRRVRAARRTRSLRRALQSRAMSETEHPDAAAVLNEHLDGWFQRDGAQLRAGEFRGGDRGMDDRAATSTELRHRARRRALRRR